MRKLAASFRFSLFLAFMLLGQGMPAALGVEPGGNALEESRNTVGDYSEEAFVMEHTSDRFQFENDGTYTREIRFRIRIQSQAGIEHFSVVQFAYQKSADDFGVDFVRVTKKDGTVVPSPSDTFQDMPADITRQAPVYSDEREMHVAVKGLGIGDVLEYQAHWRNTKPLIPGQFWLNYNFAHHGIVVEEVVEVRLPRGRAIKLKSATLQPVTAESGQYVTYTWTSSNLKDPDDKTQKQDDQKRAWQQTRGRMPEPDVELSSFANWEELGRWYESLQRDRLKPSAAIQAKAAELTKGLSDENAKVRALYDFVSTRYRYIGVVFGLGRYQPHQASEVFENEYGDCKDKHTLLASLLSAAGIKAYPALISSTHEVDQDVPSPAQFDHMITAVPQGTGYLWLDTTTEVGPFGFLIPQLRAKHALVIPDGKPALLVETAADSPFPTSERFNMKATLSDGGVLDGHVEDTERGDSEVFLRAAFRVVPLPQWKDLVQRISYGLGFSGDVSDVNVTPPEKTGEAFQVSYDYKRKDYSDWSNRRITPPLPQMTLPQVDDEITPTAPIWLGTPGEFVFNATIEVPKGYSPNFPKAVHLTNDFAEFDSRYSFDSGVITAERRLTIKLREVAVSEYPEYKAFRKAIQDDSNTYTSLSIGKASSNPSAYPNEIWNLPYSEKPEAARLYDDARAQYQRQDVQGEIASLQKAVEIDPKFVRAWLWLGEIYKANGQSDHALEAYRKA
ncbi:MAG: DUF3857 domain-containing protein, partial [Acidobacteria bacterium]|nr:DUF3857 domain-containing protein [Acidobacteriota bacterium]